MEPIHHENGNKLGQLVIRSREKLGMNGAELARRTGLTGSTILRIERGDITPGADKLNLIARELRLDPQKLLRAAGHKDLATLPAFTPYLRSKYPGMPADARNDLEQAFARIARKHGYTPDSTGPAPGEDE